MSDTGLEVIDGAAVFRTALGEELLELWPEPVGARRA
jgi:hypothetical protein